MTVFEYEKLVRGTKNDQHCYYFKGREISYDLIEVLNTLGQDSWQVAFKEDTHVIVLQRVLYQDVNNEI